MWHCSSSSHWKKDREYSEASANPSANTGLRQFQIEGYETAPTQPLKLFQVMGPELGGFQVAARKQERLWMPAIEQAGKLTLVHEPVGNVHTAECLQYAGSTLTHPHLSG